MAGHERTPLTRERIARVALELLDEQGAQGLSMRPLAARLGVRAPSLYHHVTGLDEVIGLMHDLVDTEIDLTTLDDRDWQRGLRAFAHSFRDAFRAHPHMMPLVSDRPLVSRIALGVYEALAVALRRIGCPPARVGHYMALLDNAMVGAVLNDFTIGITLPVDVDIAEFPELKRVLRSRNLLRLNDDAFDASIGLIIDDLAQTLAAKPREAAPSAAAKRQR